MAHRPYARPPRPGRYAIGGLLLAAPVAGAAGAALGLACAPGLAVVLAWAVVLTSGTAAGLLIGKRQQRRWRSR